MGPLSKNPTLATHIQITLNRVTQVKRLNKSKSLFDLVTIRCCFTRFFFEMADSDWLNFRSPSLRLIGPLAPSPSGQHLPAGRSANWAAELQLPLLERELVVELERDGQLRPHHTRGHQPRQHCLRGLSDAQENGQKGTQNGPALRNALLVRSN